MINQSNYQFYVRNNGTLTWAALYHAYLTSMCRNYKRNIDTQVSIAHHPGVIQNLSFDTKLRVTSHHFHGNMENIQLATSMPNLIAIGTHDIPPALSIFAGFFSTPLNLYRIAPFDKLNVFDLGTTRQSCKLTHDVLQKHSILPLSRVMTI